MSQAKYRARLPQTAGGIFLTDGGMETTLIYHEGLELPLFMAFPLLNDGRGLSHIRDYYRRYCRMAADARLGFVLESPTWRANRDWAERIGYSDKQLADVNRKAIDLMLELRAEFETPQSPMPISGNIGPRGDGYVPGKTMSPAEAEDYHSEQIETFRDTAADLVSAFTLNYVEEAIGVARAAKAAGIPSVISFTVETDGHLPTGQPLREAIEQTDLEAGAAPVYYMLNCAHPSHFDEQILTGGLWMKRLRGLRANASCRSHAELETATALDIGDPADLGRRYAELRRRLPHINVLGGCCGTDHRHVEQISLACVAA